MDETRRRRLSIGKELATWGREMPDLLARIGQTSTTLRLTAHDKLELEAVGRRITTLFDEIGEALDPVIDDATAYENVIGSTDKLRAEIATAYALLNHRKG